MKYVLDSAAAQGMLTMLESIMYAGYDLNAPADSMSDQEFEVLRARMNDPELIRLALTMRNQICVGLQVPETLFYQVLGVMVMSNGGDISLFRDRLVAAVCDDDEGDADRQSYLKYYLRTIRNYDGTPVVFDEVVDSAFAPL